MRAGRGNSWPRLYLYTYPVMGGKAVSSRPRVRLHCGSGGYLDSWELQDMNKLPKAAGVS